MSWYYAIGQEQKGPVEEGELQIPEISENEVREATGAE